MAGSLLDEMLERYKEQSPEEQAAFRDMAIATTKDFVWVPQIGPQTEAYDSEADEVFYGGQAGGGKSDLILGLSLTAHSESLILRRYGVDARKLSDRIEQIIGTTDGRSLSPRINWKTMGRSIEIAGCPHEDDKQRFKGNPHDFIGFDEVGDFTKSQFLFIKIWCRSAKEGQRSRIVCAGNPPTHAEGLWVIEYWGPWLDPKHANPAKSGELRWFISDADGNDQEVDGPGVYRLTHDDGKTEDVRSRSRTFIRARLQDNLYLTRTDYGATLDSLPAELRAAYRDGRFDLSLKDNPKQVIPTSWIIAAQERWRKHPRPPDGVPMCAIGVDPTGGGEDEFVMAPRYDGWFAPLIVEPGKKYPKGSDMAGQIVAKRRDGALPVVDCGGGYGGGIIQTLEQNSIEYYAYKGSEGTTMRDKSGKLKLPRVRAAAYWGMREALDPDQPGGSPIFLPDDAKLVGDLAALKFEVGPQGIEVTSKEDVCDAIGRSPDRGDAVVMSWFKGAKVSNIEGGWKGHASGRNRNPVVKMGNDAKRRGR